MNEVMRQPLFLSLLYSCKRNALQYSSFVRPTALSEAGWLSSYVKSLLCPVCLIYRLLGIYILPLELPIAQSDSDLVRVSLARSRAMSLHARLTLLSFPLAPSVILMYIISFSYQFPIFTNFRDSIWPDWAQLNLDAPDWRILRAGASVDGFRAETRAVRP